MFYWAGVFFVIAIVAGILGFGGIAGAAVGTAQIFFWVGLLLFLVTLVFGVTGRRVPRD